MMHTEDRGAATSGGEPHDHREHPRLSRPRHHRVGSRPLGDPPQLGALDRALRGPRLPRARPAYPGLEVEVESLNEDPSPIEALTIPGVVEHLEGIVAALENPPIIMGHSAGGLFTQILLDHGYGAAGVAIDSAPAEGVRVTPVSQIRVFFPFLKNPANRHKAVGFTKEQFHNSFANTLSREESDEVYERYHIPAPGSFVWAGPLANFTPGHQDTYVDFRNEERAPLLFIAGSEDNIMPPAVNQSNVKHYRHVKSLTDYKEFPGRSHYTVGQDGWEEVADYALEWAKEHATTRSARKEILMSSSSAPLSTPEGPGSVSGAPSLPEGFTDTFTSRYIDTDELRLHAVTGGDGPPLLLVHGWPENWYAWRLLMPQLARDFEVIAVDQRGIGLTDKPRDGYDTGTLADDLVALMDALGHERFAVVGHDTGYFISYALAVDHPDRVARLVVAEVPGPLGVNPSPPLFGLPEPINNKLWHLAFNRVNDEMTEQLVRGGRTSSSATSSPSRAVRGRCPTMSSDTTSTSTPTPTSCAAVSGCTARWTPPSHRT